MIRVHEVILGLGALVLAPLVLIQCATALYNGLMLGDFSYVGHLANSIEFLIECLCLNVIAVLSIIGGEE